MGFDQATASLTCNSGTFAQTTNALFSTGAYFQGTKYSCSGCDSIRDASCSGPTTT